MGMPFIIQCPHAGCGKYMLVEDSDRGSTIKCLVCKKAIKLDPTHAGETPSATAVEPGRPRRRCGRRRQRLRLFPRLPGNRRSRPPRLTQYRQGRFIPRSARTCASAPSATRR
jgi:hypothetical protein